MRYFMSMVMTVLCFHSLSAQRLVSGKIVDAITQLPLAYAQLRSLQTGSATLSNTEGEFTLKLRDPLSKDTLQVSYIGYDLALIPLAPGGNLEGETLTLQPRELTLAEVLITPKEPEELILEALEAIPQNVANNPVNMEGFFREMIKENGQYVELREGVFDFFKVPGARTETSGNQAKLLKGHRKVGEKQSENVNIDLGGGGPTRIISTPIIGEPFIVHFLNPKKFKLYTYKLEGVSTYQGRDVFVISFEQDRKMRKKLYAGTIYIDVKTMAFASIQYGFSQLGKKFRASQLGAKTATALRLARLFGVKIEFRDEQGRLDYQLVNGSWQPAYLRRYVNIYIETPKKADLPPVMNLEAARELAISEVKKGVGKPIPASERYTEDTEVSDVMEEYDPGFWAEYNFIAPTETLAEIVKEINKQQKKD